MLIHIRLDPRRLRRWHRTLVERLRERDGTAVAITWTEAGPAPPGSVAVLFSLERLLAGVPEGGSGAIEPRELSPLEARGGDAADLVIDLSGSFGGSGPAGRRWRVLFDGAPGDDALIGALLDRRSPVVAIVDEHGRTVASGRPGSENPGVVVAAVEDILARATTLLMTALSDLNPQVPSEPVPASAVTWPQVSRHLGKALPRAVLRRIYQLLYRTPHWRVGWRRVDGPGIIETGELPDAPWTDLPDDGLRFYADPFPITVAGETHLFVEDFAHRLGQGIISAVPFGEDGPLGMPRPVLECPVHLSYPFVFAHAGEIWMVPESWQAGRIDLFRATRFPGGWVREATLVEGVEASDATLCRHGGRWWMMATVRDGGGAFSDALHLWSSDALETGWRPHPQNPVLIDIAGARPAGRIVRVGDRLLRPVQDCRAGYGAALGLAEITRMDEHAFAQRIYATLPPGGRWAGRRLHTLNRDGRLEFIDGSGLAPRFRSRAGSGR